MNFQNQIIWITGASSGIGRALALALYEKGAKLILSSRREAALEKVKAECGGTDQDVKLLPLDLLETDLLPEKANTAWALFGQIDYMIHSGGKSIRARVVETKLEVDRQIMDLLYFGNITITKSLLPKMLKRKKGHIVVISSLTGKFGTPLRASYNAAKHALHGFYDSLRAEVHDDNIKITLVLPSFVNTQVSMNALKGDGSKYGITDPSIAKGISPEYTANKILRAVSREKEETLIGRPRELTAVYLKRFFPRLFSIIIRKVSVK